MFETSFAVLVTLCYKKDILFDERDLKISVAQPLPNDAFAQKFWCVT